MSAGGTFAAALDAQKSSLHYIPMVDDGLVTRLSSSFLLLVNNNSQPPDNALLFLNDTINAPPSAEPLVGVGWLREEEDDE